jgi:transposase
MFQMAVKTVIEDLPEVEFIRIEKLVPEPVCPQCGCPMVWDRDFAGYLCHHPE